MTEENIKILGYIEVAESPWKKKNNVKKELKEILLNVLFERITDTFNEEIK